jgi:osmotically-inducible protein OsmY
MVNNGSLGDDASASSTANSTQESLSTSSLSPQNKQQLYNSLALQRPGFIQPLELSMQSRDGLIKSGVTSSLEEQQRETSSDFWQTVSGVAGNVLEWCDNETRNSAVK